jgi:hypothetical protein
MEEFILWSYIFIIIVLNITFITLHKKGKVNLIFSGIVMLFLGPIFGFSSGALFLHFYDFNSGGTGEGAGYGGAFIGLITIANGFVILAIGILVWLIRFFKTRQSNKK